MKPYSLSRAQRRNRTQAGFTLVELVTVILILGVLAAVALPRYADLQGKAREAKVRGVLGSVKAASALVKATAMANGVSCGGGGSVSMEGVTVDVLHCYPQALGSLTTGIFGASNVSANDNWVLDSTNAGATSGSVVRINLSDATTTTDCSVIYKAATGATTPPEITAVTNGC